MFAPNQVGELIVGATVASQTTAATFVASAANKAIKVLSKDGTIATLNKPFYVLQKTTGDSTKNLNYEFSDKIDPQYIDKITLATYLAESAKSVKVDGFATAGVAAAARTYEIEIQLESQLSPENFEKITGYYVTGASLGSDTATTIRDGVLASLNKNLARRGNAEFTATADTTGILVTEKLQNNIPGKKDGRKLIFTVTGKVFENISTGYNSNLGVLTSTVITAGSNGQGTGKFATNFEFFAKGYKYPPDNAFGYPVNFDIPQYTSKTGIYNVIQIKYAAFRKETLTEKQAKVLTILVEKTADTNPNNVATNSVLADLRLACGSAIVPADLAVV